MSLSARERLWRMHRIVPIQVMKYDIEQMGDAFYVRMMFRHPCPCENWKMDRPFVASVRVDPVLESKSSIRKNWFKWIKDFVRKEARKHIAEFELTGTIDGAAR